MSAPFAPPQRGVRKRILLVAAALVLSWLAAVAILGRHALPPAPQAPPPVIPSQLATAEGGCPTPPPVRVYFAPPQPDDPDPIDQALLRLINSAQTSVNCAFYELGLPIVADALVSRHQAGVRVGIVSDSDYADRTAVQNCIAAGIPVAFDERPAFMHNKFCVVDERFVWTGSTNITENCMYKNNNNSHRGGGPSERFRR